MWTRIIQRIIPPEVKLRSVNLLGGRERVLSACKLDQKPDGRRKLYIIDGDLDYLRGVPKPRLKNLYRLNAYCVENIILSERAIYEVGMDSGGLKDTLSARRKINYPELIQQHDNLLKKLFVIYATAFGLSSRQQTVSYSVLSLVEETPKSAVISETKVANRIRKLHRDLCKEFGVKCVSNLRREVSRRSANVPIHRAVSGKDYIFPLVYLRLKRACDFKGSHDQLKVLLAKEYDERSEPNLARRLRRVANA